MINYCIKLLKAAGKEKIVFLGANPNSVTDNVKCNVFGKSGEIVWTNEKIEACVDEFIASIEKSGYDSVICANDTAAICLMHRLSHTSYKIPDDIYIIGMGNSFIGSVMDIPLTSVKFDYYKLGVAATKLYLSLLKSEEAFHASISLPCELVVRQSAPIFDSKNSCSKKTSSKEADNIYFSGDNVQNIIRIEAMLQASDDIDRKILYSIAKNESYDVISEKIFLCDRAIRYRIRKLISKYGFEDKKQLEEALQHAINK